MALMISDPEARRLAAELAALTGKSITEAVMTALRERLAAVRPLHDRGSAAASIRDIQLFVQSLPDRDTYRDDEVPGFDEFGLPR